MGRPIGTSKYPYRDDQEREAIVKMIKRGAPDLDIAAASGWSEKEVRDTRAMFFPRASLAADYLRARALDLAMRVVEEANVEEAIDILSRPNIGVLEPVLKAQNQPKIGIITNINTHTLGGVQPSTSTTVIDLSAEPVPVPKELPECPDPNPYPYPRLAPAPTERPVPLATASSSAPSTRKTGSGPTQPSSRPKSTPKPRPSSGAKGKAQ